jgi:hypothetical protein
MPETNNLSIQHYLQKCILRRRKIDGLNIDNNGSPHLQYSWSDADGQEEKKRIPECITHIFFVGWSICNDEMRAT